MICHVCGDAHGFALSHYCSRTCREFAETYQAMREDDEQAAADWAERHHPNRELRRAIVLGPADIARLGYGQ